MGSAIVEYMRFQKLTPQRQSRKMRAILVVLTFKASLCVLVGGGGILSFQYSVSGVCTRVLLWPMVSIAIFLMVTFICGCIGVWRQQFFLKLLYLLGCFFAILALLVFVVFGYVAVGGIDIRPVKAREYSLADYRGWLRGRVADQQYWARISACLRNRHACKAMKQLVRDPDSGMFVPQHSWAKNHDLGVGQMPIESGCCKPPSSCAFTYVNGTTWIPTRGAPAMEAITVDCSKWSNDQQTLCFQCDSCKAGLLDEIKKGWSIAAIFPVLTLIALIGTCRSQMKAMYND